MRRAMVAFVLGLLAVTSPGAEEIRSIPGFEDGSSFLVRVRFVRRAAPQSRPWEVSRLETLEAPAFFVDRNTVLVTRFPTGDLLTARILVPGEATPFEAEVLAVEPELRIGLLSIVGRKLRFEPPVVRLLTDEKLLPRLRRLDCLSLTRSASEQHTVFLKRVAAGLSPAGNTPLPVLTFTAWESGIGAGDVLVADTSIVGVIRDFSTRSRLGSAVSATHLSRFLTETRRRVAKRPTGPVVKTDSDTEEPAVRVLPHPGFSVTRLEGEQQRLYFGGNTGGVVVTHVLPHGGAAGVLFPGDLILSIEGATVNPEGLVRDPVFGLLPVEAILNLRAGRFARPGQRVKLQVSRAREIREVSIRLKPFRTANLAIPSLLEPPPYWILGGLAFIELTSDYVRETGGTPRLRHLVDSYRLRQHSSDERYIVLHQVFPTADPVTGPESERMLLVSVNGTAVRNLQHLDLLVRDAIAKKFPLRILLEGNRHIVIDPASLETRGEEVRRRHGIQFLHNLDRS